MNALSVILDFDFYVVLGCADTQTRPWSIRVAMNVGKAFLKHAENGDFGIRRKALDFLRDINVDGNSGAFGKPGSIPASSGRKAELIEQWRMKQVREGANFRGNFLV